MCYINDANIYFTFIEKEEGLIYNYRINGRRALG